MCTWINERVEIDGAGRGRTGWLPLTVANVYYDHPDHLPYDHSLNIDFVGTSGDPGERIAVELSARSARALIEGIRAALEAGARTTGEPVGEADLAVTIHVG
jgi:Family of unknown function (DUF6295)